MAIEKVPQFVREHYEIREWRHASAILQNDFPDEYGEIVDVLTAFRLRRSDIAVGGGRKSRVADALDGALYARGWVERSFDTKMVIDQDVFPSPMHHVDCFKNQVALEVEWNNKDPFFDRDLNNFRLLFELRAVSVGVIVTRMDQLQEIFKRIGRGASYGASTSNMAKLMPRIEGGSGGGRPILVFGISPRLHVDE